MAREGGSGIGGSRMVLAASVMRRGTRAARFLAVGGSGWHTTSMVVLLALLLLTILLAALTCAGARTLLLRLGWRPR